MSESTDSLWSPEIKPGSMSPRDILEVQSIALREQSGGLLSAEVREAHDKSEGAVYLIFDIFVPAVGGGRHRILTARYFADRIFPCHLDADGLRSAEVANSEEEFCEIVRQILHSGEVKSLALSLIARARDERKAGVDPLLRRHNGHRKLFRPAWIGVENEEENGSTVEALYDESHGID